jgi:hypothetical protein
MFAIADEVLVLKDLPGARLRRGRGGGFPPRTPHASPRIAPAALTGNEPHLHLEAWREVDRAFGADLLAELLSGPLAAGSVSIERFA